MVEVAQGETREHAHEGQDGGEDVVEDRLLDCHPSFQQHCKVSWFVCVKLVALCELLFLQRYHQFVCDNTFQIHS